MNFKVTLQLQSPLMVGGKKLGNNYNKSLQFIPGGVVAAGLAKAILQRCSYNENDGNYEVKYRNLHNCSNCPVQGLCKNFKDISFNNFYPFGSRPYPITSKRCKKDSSHKNIDTLMYYVKKELKKDFQGNFTCLDCKERLERKDGLYIGEKDIELVYSLVTKNAIDNYTKKAKDGYLFSLDTLLPIGYISKDKKNEKEKKQLEFIGKITGPLTLEDFRELNEIYVGAFTTKGLGRCKVMVEGDRTDNNTLKVRIDNFNKNLNIDGTVISLTLKSDCYLGLEEYFDGRNSPADLSIEEFSKIYEDYFTKVLKENLAVIKVMANHEFRRGFDTKNKKVRLRKSKLVTKAGGVIVLKFNNWTEELYQKLLTLEEKGLGNNSQYGFGEIVVCDPFHIKFKNTN